MQGPTQGPGKPKREAARGDDPREPGEAVRDRQDDLALRVIMRRLREMMAEPGDGQARLDAIVRQVANLMVADVCSLYMKRADASLELFATEGLNAGAVHNTHMKRGEGLVGLCAELAQPVNEPDAQRHPSFSYRPETGEEIYHSFLAVPILRAGHVLGVLTVQNRTLKEYSEDEVEVLQTTAMVLAEYLVSGAIAGVSATPQARTEGQAFQGQVLSEGIALGHIVLHEPRVVVTEFIAENSAAEQERLDSAIETLRGWIDEMLASGDMARGGEHRDVLEAYRMFAHDRGWLRRIKEAANAGLTAQAAVERVQNENRAQMLRQTDPYWRERLRDLDDLSDRLLRILAGRSMTAAKEALPADTILVARTMGPAELLDYDRSKLRGLIVEEGGTQSHVAIVAKAFAIPAIGLAHGVIEAVNAGDEVIIDAEAGEIHVRPAPEVVSAYSDKVRFRARRQQQYARLKDRPAVTRDGRQIRLNINAGLLVDVPHLAESGADGIGLFRTELQFMVSDSFPGRDRQTEIYKGVLDQAGGKPVVFRSLDIGGDKMLPYMQGLNLVHEQNPALGWRAIRMSLDRPSLFRTQLRALLKAAAEQELRLLLPMVTQAAELVAMRRLIDHEIELMKKLQLRPPAKVLVGVMIEVPGLLFELDALLPWVDFASVGSNDLMQFLFAADRTNERVSSRYDPLSPAGLRALKTIVEAADRHQIPLTLSLIHI